MAELKKIIVDGVEYALPEGGGTSQVFVDVDSLPTENINSNVIYRLFRVYGYINGTPQTNTAVYIVDSLPTTGENCTTDGSTFTNMYYNKSDESVYGYVDATIGAAFGVPAGWYPASSLLQIANMTYGGVVDSIVGLESGKYYFVREYDFYVYKGKWIKLDNDIVFQGEGLSSVVMNDLGNIASGKYSVAKGRETTASGYSSHAEGYGTTSSDTASHAEGYRTTASGDSSHAEGFITKASGDNSHAEGFITKASGGYSHAEGCDTTASGISSHSEGYYTIASGDRSHAEGYNTTASEESSHAEGYYTVAASPYQHVQGKYNIEDSSETYAHIVGNGSSSARSNAHTLDWDGNAWFKGKVRVGGTSWDDATELGSGGGSGGSNTQVFEIALDPSVNTFDDAGYLSVTAEQQSVLNEMGNYLARNIETIKSANILLIATVTNFEGEPGVFMDFRGGISDYVKIFVVAMAPTGQSFLNEMSEISLESKFHGTTSDITTQQELTRISFSNDKDGNNISIYSHSPVYINQLLQYPNPKIKVIFNLL